MSVHTIGRRVRIKYDPRIHESEEHAHDVTGTVIELMRVGFDVRVQWDDGQHRGRYDGWVSWTSIEPIHALKLMKEVRS